MELLEIGETAAHFRTFTQEDFDRFADLSGDANPIHVDPEYSAASRFGRPVAHGMFLYSCLCALLEEAFPGARLARQELSFTSPTFAGIPMTLRAELVEAGGAELVAAVEVSGPEGTVTCRGEARLVRDGT